MKETNDKDQSSLLRNNQEKIIITSKIIEKSTDLVTVLNILKTSIGAGILTYPYFFSLCGLIPGIIVVSAVTILTVVCTIFLVKIVEATNIGEYEDALVHFIGKWGAPIYSFLIFSLSLGASMAYVIVFGSLFWMMVLQSFGLEKDKELWTMREFYMFMSMALTLPFCLAKNTDNMKLASYFGVMGHLTFIVVLFYTLFSKIHEGTFISDYELFPPNTTLHILKIFNKIPLLFFAMTFHLFFFPILQCIKNPTSRRVTVLTAISVILVGLANILVAAAGYVLFGKKTKGNILDNMTADVVGVVPFYITGFFVSFGVIFTFPFYFFTVRNVLWDFSSQVIFFVKGKFNNPGNSQNIADPNQGNPELQQSTAFFEKKGWAFITFSIILQCLIVVGAVFIGNIVPILDIMGLITCTLIVYFLPSFMFLKVGKLFGNGWFGLGCVALGLSVVVFLVAVFALFAPLMISEDK